MEITVPAGPVEMTEGEDDDAPAGTRGAVVCVDRGGAVVIGPEVIGLRLRFGGTEPG